MPLSIGVTRWRDLDPSALAAIREHAAAKAAEPIDWDEWERLEGGSTFDVPYSVGEPLGEVLANVGGLTGRGEPCFVPYRFDTRLCPGFPPPDGFWRDELRPEGWERRTLVVIEALWAHTRWEGSMSDEHRSHARRLAGEFDALFEERRGGADPGAVDFELLDAAYHHIEVGLIDALGRGIEERLPVVVFS